MDFILLPRGEALRWRRCPSWAFPPLLNCGRAFSRGLFFCANQPVGPYIDAMRYALIVLAAVAALLPGTGVASDDGNLSCAELAKRRANQQYADDIAALEDRQAGLMGDGAVMRDLLRLDAKAYQAEVYKDCIKQRGEAPTPDGTPSAKE